MVEHTAPDATVYTDEASAYEGLPRPHESVKHSASEYVRGQIHTNGVESFWSMMKRGYIGIYHKMSPKHLHRYVSEFAGRHNDRESDTADQMGNLVRGMAGKSLTYDELIAPNGQYRSSGNRCTIGGTHQPTDASGTYCKECLGPPGEARKSYEHPPWPRHARHDAQTPRGSPHDMSGGSPSNFCWLWRRGLPPSLHLEAGRL